jgi:hypothetical protein
MTITRALCILVLMAPAAASAASSDEASCRNGLFPIQNRQIGLGVIVGSERAHFVDDTARCPSFASECRKQAYLVEGDHVLTGRTRGKFVCVFYPSRGGGTAAWLDAARFRALPVQPNPPSSAWLGRWSAEGNPRVRFMMGPAGLRVEGEAAWPSFNPPVDQFLGGGHVGEVGEAVRISGNKAFALECDITFTLLGDFLVAADPTGLCGGANVRFTAVYRRAAR